MTTFQSKLQVRRSHILRSPQMLDENVAPSRLVCRDVQIAELEEQCSLVFKATVHSSNEGHGLFDNCLFGGTGTGKTALLRQIHVRVKERKKPFNHPRNAKAKVFTAYVNCLKIRKERTLWASIAKQISNTEFTSTASTDTVIEDVFTTTRGNYLILFFDELDVITRPGGEYVKRALEILSRDPAVILISATNVMTWKQKLEGKAKSSFDPRLIKCDRYSEDELYVIGAARISDALTPKAVSEEILRKIVRYAHRIGGGDARKLIQLLRFTVDHAERQGFRKIAIENVEYARRQMEGVDALEYLLYRPHDVHILLTILIVPGLVGIDPEAAKRGLETDIVKGKYDELIQLTGEEPLKYRALMNHLVDLDLEGVVHRSKGSGRINIFNYKFKGPKLGGFDGVLFLKQLQKRCKDCELLIKRLEERKEIVKDDLRLIKMFDPDARSE